MRVNRDRSSAPQVVCCFRRYLALAARPKCVLHGGREGLTAREPAMRPLSRAQYKSRYPSD